MKKRMLLVGIAALALFAAIPAHAALTLSGQTGVGLVPTADTLKPLSIAIAADYVDTTPEPYYPVRLEFGLFPGLELGGNFTSQKDNESWGLNAKYRLPFAPVEGLGIAAGVNYQDNSDSEISSIIGYAVTSYNIKTEFLVPQVSVGVNYQTLKQEGLDDLTGVHVFGALSIGFLEQFAVAAEFETKKDDIDSDSLLTMAGRYMPKQLPGLALQAGTTNSHLAKQRFFAGAQYAFSFTK